MDRPTEPKSDPILADPGVDSAEIREMLSLAIRRACRGWSREEQEDLVQTAVVKILSSHSAETGRPLSRSYLWKTAFSVVADEVRRRARRPESGMDEPPEVSVAPAASESLALRELGVAIRDCMRRVVASRRALVNLYLLGHAVGEIEAMSAEGSKRTKNLLYRGLNDLRGCLRGKGYGA